MGFIGRSSWRRVVKVFAALRECEALKQTGASLASTRFIGGISFFLSFSEK